MGPVLLATLLRLWFDKVVALARPRCDPVVAPWRAFGDLVAALLYEAGALGLLLSPSSVGRWTRTDNVVVVVVALAIFVFGFVDKLTILISEYVVMLKIDTRTCYL